MKTIFWDRGGELFASANSCLDVLTKRDNHLAGLMKNLITAREAIENESARVLAVRTAIFAETDFMLWSHCEYSDTAADEATRRNGQKLTGWQKYFQRSCVTLSEGRFLMRGNGVFVHTGVRAEKVRDVAAPNGHARH